MKEVAGRSSWREIISFQEFLHITEGFEHIMNNLKLTPPPSWGVWRCWETRSGTPQQTGSWALWKQSNPRVAEVMKYGCIHSFHHVIESVGEISHI